MRLAIIFALLLASVSGFAYGSWLVSKPAPSYYVVIESFPALPQPDPPPPDPLGAP